MQITLTLNDKKLTADVAPDTLLIDFVRSHGCLSVKRGQLRPLHGLPRRQAGAVLLRSRGPRGWP